MLTKHVIKSFSISDLWILCTSLPYLLMISLPLCCLSRTIKFLLMLLLMPHVECAVAVICTCWMGTVLTLSSEQCFRIKNIS